MKSKNIRQEQDIRRMIL